MTRLNQIGLGLRTYGEAVRFIFRNKLAWTFLVPLVLSILLIIGGQALITDLVDYLKVIVLNWIKLDESGFWGEFLGGLVEVVIRVVSFLVFAYLSGYIIIILMSPILAYISEKTEQIITGNTYKTSVKQLIKDIIRGILLASRNFLIEVFFIILMFFISFIPVIGWLGTIVLFVISSYFYGFSFIDYNNERQKMSISESVSVVRKFRWLAISNGSVFSFFLVVPFCGSFVSTFAAIISTVAATLAIHRTDAYSSETD
jgi:CysZ protein